MTKAMLRKIKELGTRARRLNVDEIMLRWEAGIILNKAYPDKLVPLSERIPLRNEGGMSIPIAHSCQLFNRKLPNAIDARNFAEVSNGWTDIQWAVKHDNPWDQLLAARLDKELYKSDFDAWKKKQKENYRIWADEKIRRSENADNNIKYRIIVTVPADFVRELIDKEFTRRQIQRVFLAYHNFPEIKDDIRAMLNSGEGLS